MKIIDSGINQIYGNIKYVYAFHSCHFVMEAQPKMLRVMYRYTVMRHGPYIVEGGAMENYNIETESKACHLFICTT